MSTISKVLQFFNDFYTRFIDWLFWVFFVEKMLVLGSICLKNSENILDVYIVVSTTQNLNENIVMLFRYSFLHILF